jgi:uncharacterized protein
MRGIQLFNDEQFFECHEVLEEVWMQVSGEQKIFLQGIIQVAVALHHLKRDNLVGARRLLDAGTKKLAQFAPSHETVDVARLLMDVQPLATRIKFPQAGQAAPTFVIPKLQTLAG